MTSNNVSPTPPGFGGSPVPPGPPAVPAFSSSSVPPPQAPQAAKRRGKGKIVAIILLSVLLGTSVVVNLYLLALIGAELEPGVDTKTISRGSAAQTIALCGIEGLIDGATALRFARFYDQVAWDDNVKAIVLRVESPGGGVSASDRIHELIKQLRAKGKIVVVSMGNVATSGGYYISAGADEIVAEPTTVTGSIGVLAGWVMIKDTLKKVGAEVMVVKSTHARGWKDEWSSFKRPDQRQLAHLQTMLDKIQARFEQIVTDGRGERLVLRAVAPYTIQVGEGEQAKSIIIKETEPFNGKVYLAEEALDLGLIDKIGYHDRAIARAKALAELTDPKVVRYMPRKSVWARLMESRAPSALIVDRRMIDELQTPRLQLIWKID